MDPIFRMLYYSELYPKNSASYHAMMQLSQNLGQIRDLSIDEIAQMCNTNAMTLSRLARKIGYHNFSEFRNASDEVISQYHYLNRNIPINAIDLEDPAGSFLEYMEETIRTLRESSIKAEIRKVCFLLHEAKDIHYYGPPFQSLYIIMLLHDLLMEGKAIYTLTSRDNISADLPTLKEDSVLILEPNTLTTEMDLCREVLAEAKKKGTKVVLLAEETSPLIAFSPEHNLTYPSSGTASNVITQQFVINMLTMEYRARYFDRKQLQ